MLSLLPVPLQGAAQGYPQTTSLNLDPEYTVAAPAVYRLHELVSAPVSLLDLHLTAGGCPPVVPVSGGL